MCVGLCIDDRRRRVVNGRGGIGTTARGTGAGRDHNEEESEPHGANLTLFAELDTSFWIGGRRLGPDG